MWSLVQTNFNSILIALVALVALVMFRNSIHQLEDFVFGGTLIAGTYLSIATFFPDDMPRLVESDGMMALAAVTVIVVLSRWAGNEWHIKTLRLIVIGLSFLSLYQLVVVGFMFNGTPPTAAAWSLRIQANSDSYTAFLLFGGGVFVLLALFLITRRSYTMVQKSINRSKSETYDEKKNLNVDVREHDIRNTQITQTIPAVPQAKVKRTGAIIYRTPSQPTTRTVNPGATFRALARTPDCSVINLINSQGQSFWLEAKHLDFGSADPQQLPVIEMPNR